MKRLALILCVSIPCSVGLCRSQEARYERVAFVKGGEILVYMGEDRLVDRKSVV